MTGSGSPGFLCQQWLQVNWETLVNANLPAMKIVDYLVAHCVLSPLEDEYQRINAEPTDKSKVRLLLEAMSTKHCQQIDHFKEALTLWRPCVLANCIEPPHALHELKAKACSLYKSLEVKPFTWLPDTQPIAVNTFLNLCAIEKKVADGMMSACASSSTTEMERQEYIYSQPDHLALVHLNNLFPQTQENPFFEPGWGAEVSVAAVHSGVGVTTLSNVSAAVPGSGIDVQRWHSVKHVGIYGGAGCGKTSCLMKAASLYAEKKLWPGACAFLLWKSRDPNVQDATNLTELLRELNLDFTVEECAQMALSLHVSDGEKVILALDGVDELNETKGYICRLLDGSVLKKACILATSRPCSSARMYFGKYKANLELVGFTEEQVDLFIHQQLGDDPNLISELQRVLLENPMLASLMLVPLLAMMVCQVFRLTVDRPPTTRTMLYSKLLALVLQRTVEESEGRVRLPPGQIDDVLMASKVREIPVDCMAGKLLAELVNLAYLAHETGKAVFTHDFVRTAKCSNESLKVGLLARYDVRRGTAVMPQYSFQHLTVQEFLVAYHLVADITSWEKLTGIVRELIQFGHNHVVLQFFAGLLEERLRPHLFALLNQWLHEGYDQFSEECRGRLRICLQCAKESCSADEESFPTTLQLPREISLKHVTAADLMLLSLALDNTPHVESLTLNFDRVHSVPDDEKDSRVRMQTRRAMTRLMNAVAKKSLRFLVVWGPNYSLFEEGGWQLLVETVAKGTLEWLNVNSCELDNTSFYRLSNELQQNTQLVRLFLWGNHLNDASLCTLAADLKHNNTLREINLSRNSVREECIEHLKQELSHIEYVDL